MLKTTREQEIRFADIDSMGHVNNAVYLNYFEQSRIHFFAVLLESPWDWKKRGVIVVKNEIEYRKPIVLEDRIQIDTECTHVGNRSFTLTYKVYRHEEPETVFCFGSSILVCYDYQENTSTPMPGDWKERLSKGL